MGKLEKLVPLAETVYRELMDDLDAKDSVRADVATKVLESEGFLRTPKNEGGRTFVLNLKTDDVVGALQGMRTVFGGEEGEIVAEPVKKIAPKAKERKEVIEDVEEEDDQYILRRAIEAERGVSGANEPEGRERVSAEPSAEEREDAVHGEGDV